MTGLRKSLQFHILSVKPNLIFIDRTSHNSASSAKDSLSRPIPLRPSVPRVRFRRNVPGTVEPSFLQRQEFRDIHEAGLPLPQQAAKGNGTSSSDELACYFAADGSIIWRFWLSTFVWQRPRHSYRLHKERGCLVERDSTLLT